MAQGWILKLTYGKHHFTPTCCLSRLPCLFSSMREPTAGFNFDDEGKNVRKNQNPPEPIPGRRLRGERPPSFNTYSETHSAHHSAPNPRPPKRIPSSATQRTPVSVPNYLRRPNSETHNIDDSQNLSDAAFLDQFKLGVKENRDSQNLENSTTTTTTTETTTTTSSTITTATSNSTFSAAKDTQENSISESDRMPPPEDAQKIFKKMKETGLIPNAVAMLDGLCKDGLIQEAMKLFGLIREKGTIPDVVVYTAVVDGFCKAHQFDDAKRIFRKMQSNGISPNAFSYTVLIQGLYKCNHLDDAIDFCVEMLEAGHSPNIATFVGLVEGLCKEKGVEEAQNVITRLRNKGLFIDDKALRDFLNINAPGPSQVREAIFGNNTPERPF
uniref:Pentatricopeptide repeat-containing protein n=1 Tax=Rhizophora mucronata TaxID=61149 RepID=A0A2P2JKH2_RHIMU